MHEILAALERGQRVLDLGSGEAGSFDPSATRAQTVRADIAAPPERGAPAFVAADAGALPFASRSFALVVCNNSLEHFADPGRALAEISRVLEEEGTLFVTAPDAGALADRLYRWLARGGGHVNRFYSPGDVISLVRPATGLECKASKTLFASFSFLHPRNRGARPPRRLWLLGMPGARALRLATYLFRLCDRAFGTRLSVYGWAFYFGALPVAADTRPCPNVCICCGAGRPSRQLREDGALLRGCWPPAYKCPACGCRNLYTEDCS